MYRKKFLLLGAVFIVIAIVICFALLVESHGRNDILFSKGEITVFAPQSDSGLITVVTGGRDDWMEEVVALYFKPAYETNKNFGLLFSIRFCSYNQMQTMTQDGLDGVVFKATDGTDYYFIDEPTDVQWHSSDEYVEYERVRNAIKVSFGNLEKIIEME